LKGNVEEGKTEGYKYKSNGNFTSSDLSRKPLGSEAQETGCVSDNRWNRFYTTESAQFHDTGFFLRS
jgi:hypothetical protein